MKTLLHTTTGHVAAGAVARPRCASAGGPSWPMDRTDHPSGVASSFATRHPARRPEEPSQ